MNSLCKTICSLLCALLLLYTGACNKESNSSPKQIPPVIPITTPPTNIESILAGSYECIVSYQCTRMAAGGGPYQFDTVLGIDTIVFSSRSAAFTETGNFMISTSVGLNGDTLTQINDTTYYWDYMGVYDEKATFFRVNDSLSISYQQGTGNYNKVFNFYNGHKIH